MVYVGGQAGAGGAKIVFGEIPVTTSDSEAVTVTLGGTPKYLSVIPKETNSNTGMSAVPCAFANPVIGDWSYITATNENGNKPFLIIKITATGFIAQRTSLGATGNTVPFGYLAIM